MDKLTWSPGSKPNNVCFNVVYAAGFAKADDAAVLLKGAAFPTGAKQCAEHWMFEKIKEALKGKGGYLMVSQDLGPCPACLSSYACLSANKDLTIMVFYETKYHILTKGPGAVIFTPSKNAYWFK